MGGRVDLGIRTRINLYDVEDQDIIHFVNGELDDFRVEIVVRSEGLFWEAGTLYFIGLSDGKVSGHFDFGERIGMTVYERLEKQLSVLNQDYVIEAYRDC